MPRAGFEPTITVLERSKIVGALDHAAIGTGLLVIYTHEIDKIIQG
jgi:hypothetical protein